MFWNLYLNIFFISHFSYFSFILESKIIKENANNTIFLNNQHIMKNVLSFFVNYSILFRTI